MEISGNIHHGAKETTKYIALGKQTREPSNQNLKRKQRGKPEAKRKKAKS